MEKLCSANGSKVRSSIGTEVNVFSFNSSTAGLSSRLVFTFTVHQVGNNFPFYFYFEII